LESARCTLLVARGYPTQRFSGDPDAEATRLGIVNHNMRTIYEQDGKELLRVEDFNIGLRLSTIL